MYNSALQLGNIFGIPIRLHWTFLFVFIYIFGFGWLESFNILAWIWFAIFINLLFVSVIFHELGHAFVARWFGIATRDVIISPLGGVARLEGMSDIAREELYIALAGPMINVFMAALLAFAAYLWNLEFVPSFPLINWMQHFENLIPALFWLNLVLAIFNMFPAFPMDGGRVLRALLSMRISFLRATSIASYSGQFFGILFIFYGIYQWEWVLPLVGGFVMLNAHLELRHVRQKHHLSNTQGDRIMRPFTPIQLQGSVEIVYERFRKNDEKNFLVFENDQVVGCISEYSIFESLYFRPGTREVAHLMTSAFEVIDGQSSIKEVVNLFNTSKCYIIAIQKNDEICGVIDRNDLDTYLRKLN